MIDFIWDIFQQSQISGLNQSLNSKARHDSYQDSKISMAGHDMRDLVQRHEQLKLGAVDVSRLNFVQSKCALIATRAR